MYISKDSRKRKRSVDDPGYFIHDEIEEFLIQDRLVLSNKVFCTRIRLLGASFGGIGSGAEIAELGL